MKIKVVYFSNYVFVRRKGSSSAIENIGIISFWFVNTNYDTLGSMECWLFQNRYSPWPNICYCKIKFFKVCFFFFFQNIKGLKKNIETYLLRLTRPTWGSSHLLSYYLSKSHKWKVLTHVKNVTYAGKIKYNKHSYMHKIKTFLQVSRHSELYIFSYTLLTAYFYQILCCCFCCSYESKYCFNGLVEEISLTCNR